MSPEDREAIAEVIKLTVNGKIDRLTQLVNDHNEKHERDMEKVNDHIESTKPILEAYQGGKAIGSLIKWGAGVGAAYLLITGWLPK